MGRERVYNGLRGRAAFFKASERCANVAVMPRAVPLLPPTCPDLKDPDARPYFLWWTDITAGDLRRLLGSTDPEERAYWMAALLREANTRDVWQFVQPRDIRALWPRLIRYLGRSRMMWAYLLGLEATPWPPPEARSA
jgi:hypothetical protein